MVEGIKEAWVKEGLPVNSAGDVGRVVLEVAVGLKGGDLNGAKKAGVKSDVGVGEETGRWNGRAVFVEGGRGWDIEEGISATEPIWLGEKVSSTLAHGQEVLGNGTDWTKPDAKQ